MATSVSRPLAVSMTMSKPAFDWIGTQGFADLKAGFFRHHYVKQDQGPGSKLATLASASSPSTGNRDSKTFFFHEEFEGDDDVGFVINNQDFLGHAVSLPLLFFRCRQGHRENEVRSLAPGSLSTQRLPPKYSTIWRLIGKPQTGALGLVSHCVSTLTEFFKNNDRILHAVRPGPLSLALRYEPSGSAELETLT